jgi:hypothetical protein
VGFHPIGREALAASIFAAAGAADPGQRCGQAQQGGVGVLIAIFVGETDPMALRRHR